MLKKKSNSGNKGKTTVFDSLKPSTTQKRKLVSAEEEEDPLAITEADLRTFETPPKKRKTATAETENWSSKVIFKHGKVQLIEDSPHSSKSSGKKGKKTEPTVKFTTVAAKKYIPGTPVSNSTVTTKTNTTPKSILKKTSNKNSTKKPSPQKCIPATTGRERRQAAPTYLREDTPSPVRGSKRQSNSTYSPNSKKKSTSKSKTSPEFKSEPKSRQPSIVLSSSICEAANPKVLLTNYKPNRKSQPSVVLTSCKKTSKEQRQKENNTKSTSPAKAKASSSKSKARPTKKQSKSSPNLKMLLKRNKRRIKPAQRSPSPPPAKKLKTNNIKKTKQNTAGPKSMKKKMTQEDVSRLLKKYKRLLPAIPPVVRLKQLTFKASHHTGEPYRLPSDVNLIRDSAAFYDILGIIFQHLDVSDKFKALTACKLWNRAGKEETSWKKMIFINRHLLSLKPLERLILKHETEILRLENVTVSEDAKQYDFCRFSSVKDITCSQTDPQFLENILRASNELEHIRILDENIEVLREANSCAIKTIIAPMATIHTTVNVLKRFNDLEKLVLHTFDPESYKQMGLLLSLKELALTHLYITFDIENFIENIPNIEYMRFNPIYGKENVYETEINCKLVEGLKRCPSLKKLVWIVYEEVVVEKAEILKKEEPLFTDEDQLKEKYEKPLSPVVLTSGENLPPIENISEPMDTKISQIPDTVPEASQVVSDDKLISTEQAETPSKSIIASSEETDISSAEPIWAHEKLNSINTATHDEPLDTALEQIDSPEEPQLLSSEQSNFEEPQKMFAAQASEQINKNETSVEPMETNADDEIEKGQCADTQSSVSEQVVNSPINNTAIDEPMKANEITEEKYDGAQSKNNTNNEQDGNEKELTENGDTLDSSKKNENSLENGVNDDCTAKEFKEESIESDNEEEKKEDASDDKPKFMVEDLKKIAFKFYLTHSLPDCAIHFKIIKKFCYVKQSD